MSIYTDAELNLMDPEVRELAVQQQRGDTDMVRPQEFGHQPVLSLDAMTSGDDPYVTAGPDNTQEAVDGPALEVPEPRATIAVRLALAELSETQQETYRLIYMDRLTIREAGQRLGIAHTSVLARLRTIHAAVGKAVVEAGE